MKITTKLAIKRSIKSVASKAPIRRSFRRASADALQIFAYHRVVSDIAKAERDAIYGIVISTDTFRRHCEILRRSYDVVSLETAMQNLAQKREASRPMAVITFDDGYSDFYEQAFPVLNNFGLPATVFLPTDFIEQNTPLAHDRIFWLLKTAFEKSFSVGNALRNAGVSDDVADGCVRSRNLLKATDLLVYLPNELREKVIREIKRELGEAFEAYPSEFRLLDWEQVREMSQHRIDFGGHTANHVVLPLENESVIRTEIKRSKQTLETELGKNIVSFAYPNGEYNASIKQITKNAGYRVAVTTEKKMNGLETDVFALGRTSLCEESTRGISGRYSESVAVFRLGV